MSDSQIKIPSYISYRSDRANRTRGGCVTYIHEGISVGSKASFDNKYCEVVIAPFVKVKTAIVNIYRPPNCPLAKFRQALDFVENYVKQDLLRDDSRSVAQRKH